MTIRPVDLPPVITAHLMKHADITPSHVKAHAAKKRGGANPCMWFGGCDKPATGTTPHSTLGDVPTCDSCAEFAR